jgi:DNA polymerase I-like protein with 3'-5' exonuclease and polymerase domains
MKRLPPLDSPTNVLVAAALNAGIEFLPYGSQVQTIGEIPPELWPVVTELKNRKTELRSILGCDTWQMSVDTLGRLGVTAVVPETAQKARVLLAEMIADSTAITPQSVQKRQGCWLGFDLETATLEDEDRPGVKLLKKKGRHADAGHRAATQPVFRGNAGLDHHRSRIRLAQVFGGGKRAMVFDTDKVPLGVIMPDILKHTIVVHGATFELRFLAEAGYEVTRYEDTVQSSSLLLGVHRCGLEEAVRSYLGIELDKTLQTGDWRAPLLDPAQYAYAALDAVTVHMLWHKQRLELHEKGRMPAYRLQRDVAAPTVRMIRRGLLPDLPRHARLIAKWESEKAAHEAAFTADQGRSPPTTAAETIDFLASVLPKPVLDVWPLTAKTGKLSTAGKDLRRYAHLPAIESLLKIIAINKLLSTFGDKLASKVSAVTGRIHPGFRVASAKSGRFSCADPNLQQIPKNKAPGLRGCFIAAPGTVFVIADYSSMELRAAGEISGDVKWRADFAAGLDPHRMLAAALLKVPYEEFTEERFSDFKKLRNAAKPFNFGTIYGAGDGGLIEIAWANFGIVLSPDKARDGRVGLLQDHPEYAAWMDTIYAESNTQGAIKIGKFGRVIEAAWEGPRLADGSYHWQAGDDTSSLFNVFMDDHDQEKETEEYEAPRRRTPNWQRKLKRTLCVNAPVQGACADVSMLALLYADQDLRDAEIRGGVVLFVHDELVAEVAEADAERAKEIIKAAMTRAFSEVFPDAPLSDLVDTKISRTWDPDGKPADTAGSAAEPADGPTLPARGVPQPGGDNGTIDAPAPMDQRGRTSG